MFVIKLTEENKHKKQMAIRAHDDQRWLQDAAVDVLVKLYLKGENNACLNCMCHVYHMYHMYHME